MILYDMSLLAHAPDRLGYFVDVVLCLDWRRL